MESIEFISWLGCWFYMGCWVVLPTGETGGQEQTQICLKLRPSD